MFTTFNNFLFTSYNTFQCVYYLHYLCVYYFQYIPMCLLLSMHTYVFTSYITSVFTTFNIYRCVYYLQYQCIYHCVSLVSPHFVFLIFLKIFVARDDFKDDLEPKHFNWRLLLLLLLLPAWLYLLINFDCECPSDIFSILFCILELKDNGWWVQKMNWQMKLCCSSENDQIQANCKKLETASSTRFPKSQN